MGGKSEIIAEILRADGSPVEGDSEILQPVLHLLSAPRKSFLRRNIPAMNYWLRVPQDIVDKVMYICETLNDTLYL